MNKNIGAIVGVIVLVVVGAVYVSANRGDDKMMSKEKMMDSGVMNDAGMSEEGKMVENKMMADKEMTEKAEMESSSSEVMMKVGSYEAYSADKIARAETGDVVIFFHASWCPSCRGLNSDIESNLKSIPEGVTILKADYDKETEMKKKYGVTTQHTLVQVDKDGNMIKKWSGGGSLDSVLSKIN